jgi:predicted exporter
VPPPQAAAAVRRYTRFHSTLPAAEIVARLTAELREAGIPHTVHPAAFKIKVAADGHNRPMRCTVQVSHRRMQLPALPAPPSTTRIRAAVTAPVPGLPTPQPRLPQVFAITAGLHLVDWRRGAGDVVAYHKFYEAMRLRLGDLVTEGKPAGHLPKAAGEQDSRAGLHAGSRQPSANV